MNLPAKSVRHAVLLGLTLLLFAGCSLIPQPSRTIDELAGEWQFVDSQGVTSTLIIDESGQYTVDRAPEEAFRVLGGRADFFEWDRTVDWERAQPVSGVASIDQTGQVRFSTRSPEWGGSAAYQNPFEGSLEFIVGNVDNGDYIVYVRADDE